MKILSLKTKKFRGIRELDLSPEGKNIVVWGPNGSGKSAVVDAVDFLLTGRISRLVGEGTKGLDLKKHGPHVDHEPADAIVEAVLEVPGYTKPVTISRCVASPKELKCDPEVAPLLEPIFSLADKGQNVLSRRNILRFIASEASKRAQDVATLLDLETTEEIRGTLDRLKKDRKQNLGVLEAEQRTTQDRLRGLLALKDLSPALLLSGINTFRVAAGAAPLEALVSPDPRVGMKSPASAASAPPAVILLESNLETFNKARAALAEEGPRLDETLRSAIARLKASTAARDQLTRLRLLRQGLALIPEDGSCPLCGTAWPPAALASHLQSHISAAEQLEKNAAALDEAAEALRLSLADCATALKALQASADVLLPDDRAVPLKTWAEKFEGAIKSLEAPLETFEREQPDAAWLAATTLFETGDAVLPTLASEKLRRYPPPDTRQQAWDTLTAVSEHTAPHLKSAERIARAARELEVATAMAEEFAEARDFALDSLYKSIEARFTTLYRALHIEDEGTFESTLRPAGAGLLLEVDFYNKGKYPPLAVHSEGHQDTMGLCLYLALVERLTDGILNLTVLDDVVMSVDSGHRRKLCELLAREFKDRQFVITTCDRTWARQLLSTSLVTKKNSVEFYGWSLAEGPVFSCDEDLASRLDDDLARNDVSAAAGRLRRNAEEFFEQACDALGAKLVYRSAGEYTLGDYAPAAQSRFVGLLKKARAASQAWNDKGALEAITALETTAASVFQRAEIERWLLNIGTHHNPWADLHKNDFLPVMEAWLDLFLLFKCSHCGSVLKTEGAPETTALRCRCGTVNFNLVRPTAADRARLSLPAPIPPAAGE